MLRSTNAILLCVFAFLDVFTPSEAQPTQQTATYRRIKAYLDSVPAINTHDHLWPFQRLSTGTAVKSPDAMNLYTLWKNSYYTCYNPLAERKPGEPFDSWWPRARDDFGDAH